MSTLTMISGPAQFDELVVKSPVPVLVDFYAEWCGPCHAAAPVLEELSTQYAGKLSIVKVDVDDPENRAAVMQHGVMSIPTVVMYKDGKPFGKPQIGFAGPQTYEPLIQSAVA